MKACLLYNGEIEAGIRSRTYEIDFGDLFDQILEDEPNERKSIKFALGTLAVLGDGDFPDRILLSDECECCGKVVEEGKQCCLSD